jgi:hypothetical protein
MALKPCKECGREVSSKADKCPQCGSPIKSKGFGCLSSFVIILIATVLIVLKMLYEPSTNNSTTYPSEKTISVDSSSEAQNRRQKFINDNIESGVFYKVEKNGKFPHIYVNTGFYMLNYDDKSTFINPVLTYYYVQNKQAYLAVLFDSQSGKKIGTFSYELGLRLK